MTFWKLIRRSLRFHARSHLGVVLGAAIGSAVLIGALVVGDSVRGSLHERAGLRLGQAAFALMSGDRFLRQELQGYFPGAVDKIDEKGRRVLLPTRSSGALVFPGTAAREDGKARANHVQLIGVSIHRGELQNESWVNGFFGLATVPSATKILPGQVHLNRALANQLGAKLGDELVLRVDKLSALPQDAAVSPRGPAVALRLRVADIRSAAQFGDFNLRISAEPPLNVFVNLSDLQEATGLTGRVNVLLAPRHLSGGYPIQSALQRWLPHSYYNDLEILTVNWKIWNKGYRQAWINDKVELPRIQENFASNFQLLDAELELRQLTNGGAFELRSRRVFLDPPVERAGLAAATNAQSSLTYLVNLINAGTNATPYSMVTAAGLPWTPADMRDGEIILNQWLADDLQVKPGDEISLAYFDPESGARLVERTNIFRVRRIVPIEMPWADRTLMPDFPGIEKAESTSDWDAGFPLVHKIRPKDEDYWKKYRGTPKAFVTLAAGKKMWANRFGELTAIRFPIPTNMASTLTPALSLRERENRSLSPGNIRADDSSTVSGKSENAQRLSPLPAGEGQGEGERHAQTSQSESPDVVSYKEALEKKILASLKPEELGLRFEPVREQALKASEQSQDFGQLFLGFSFFIIVAALVLMALLFQFGLEQRTTEIGTLLALGFTQKQVRKLLLREGIVLALIGGAIGAVGGIFYAKMMLHGLTTVWRDAIGNSSLQFYASLKTLLLGFLASTFIATVAIWLTLRRQAKRPVHELLAEGGDGLSALGHRLSRRRRLATVLGIVCSMGAIGLVGYAISKGETTNAEIFFSAGALVLISGLAFTSRWLKQLATRATSQKLSLGNFGVRNSSRRSKRTLATISMLACGSFLIVAVSAFRLDSTQNATKRSSGTGGFALIGEATMPVVHDLNSKSGREFFALSEKDLAGVSFVPFRVHEGGEASCLNLNRAQKPRLLGVKPEYLTWGRFTVAETAFDMTKSLDWPMLRRDDLKLQLENDEIPAIGDANSIRWALGKKIGDTIDYTDERGNVFRLRLVGAVANSILQGSLIIDEAEFVKRFPSESGYKFFLIDAPTDRIAEVSATLSRAMEDVGLELTPAARRLNEFNAVQNTYLGTFQVLGGLGLLLGSAGLGIVVLRNVLERRGELGLLVAVGFRKRALQWMLLSEHGALLALGLGIGLLAAAVAILPSLISPSAQIPFDSVAITLGAVLLNGALWTWIATRIAVRGNLLAALRNE